MEKVKTQIFDVSYEGAGVGKTDGQIVFVPKSLPEEELEIEIQKKTNKFLIGKISKIIKPNKNRITAACPYFDVCGGCDFQHCTDECERQLKIHILKNELKKVGFNGDVEFESSDKRLGYRNKIKFEVKDGKIGYFKTKSHNFFEVEFCPIASKKINDSLPKIKEFLQANNFENLQNVYVKENEKSVGICFLFSKNAKKYAKNAKKIEILSNFDVFFAFGDILESDKTKLICVLGDKKFDMRAFSQVNNFVAQKLYETLCNLAEGQVVVNAYSGQGVLSKMLAQKCKLVYGIEMQKSAHNKAELIKTANMTNICGKVEEKLKTINKKVDAIILDPARAGCQASVLQEIKNRKIEKVFYVSCNFATLIRDIKILQENYAIQSIKIFDMFPMTASLETLVIMGRKAN